MAPGALGYLGILTDHAPLVTTLVPGNVVVRDSSGATTIFRSTGGGLLEVRKNKVVLLLDEVAG